MPTRKKKAIGITTTSQSSVGHVPAVGQSDRPKTGVWATAKFNFTPDPKFMQRYVDLLNQGKTHEEAMEILTREALPPKQQ